VPRFLTYAAPFSRDFAASWYRYRDRIADALAAGADARVIADDDPIFAPGIAAAHALARVNAKQPAAAEIILAQWTAFDRYSASVVFLGDGVSAESIKRALSAETLIREQAGELAVETALMFCFEPNLFRENGLASVIQIVQRMPNRVYVVSARGMIDRDRFELVHSPSGEEAMGVVALRPRAPEAEVELLQEAWRDGVAVLEAVDPLLADFAWFKEYDNELAIFLGNAPSRGSKRLTIGRCHQDDELVAVYGHPVGDTAIYFFV
jgi:hypothetical protein